MERKAVSRIMLTLLLISMFGVASSITPVVAVFWYPYYPSPDEVSLQMTSHELLGTNYYYIDLWMVVPYSEIYWMWDALGRFGSELRGGCEIWRHMPPTPGQTGLCRVYDVGFLKNGSYTFTFEVWHIPFKNISFTVIAPEVNVVCPGYSPDLVPGAVFDVFITIDDVWALGSYEYVLLFDPCILEVVDWESYPPLNYDLAPPPGSGPNNTAGYIHMAYFNDITYLTTYDPAPISRISFHVKDVGVSRLDFKLLGLLGPGKMPQYIKLLMASISPFFAEVKHGFFSNVPPAIVALEELIETVETSNLPKGTENSLVSKLDDAIHLFNKGKENGAIHKLMDFIDQVEALREQKLTDGQADQLISEAQRIIDLIEG